MDLALALSFNVNVRVGLKISLVPWTEREREERQ